MADFREVEIRRGGRGWLSVAGASSSVVLGGFAASVGVAGIVDLVRQLSSGDDTMRWTFGAIVAGVVVILALLGLGSFAFAFGVRGLWHCLVKAILRRHREIGR